MFDACELKLLFAVNYSDSCFKAIRAVAQMADVFRLGMTIAHVAPPDGANTGELRSFFAEADRYDACERIQLHGDPAESLTALARNGGYDLILAPRSDRLGLPRFFKRSLRLDLLRSGNTPVWTIDRGLDALDFRRPYRTIAVFLDGRDDNLTHVRLAASFAARAGATLRILTVVPPINEGTIQPSSILKPTATNDAATARVRRLLGDWSRLPAIDVTTGDPDAEIPRMVAKCGADLLFLSERRSCRDVFFRRMSRSVDRSPCAVIAVPANLPEDFNWRFCELPDRTGDMLPRLRNGDAEFEAAADGADS